MLLFLQIDKYFGDTPIRVMLKLGGKYAYVDVDDSFVSSHKKRKKFLLLLDINFENLTIGLHSLMISIMFAKFQEVQTSIFM